MSDFDEILRERLREGESLEVGLEDLHLNGARLIDAVQAVRRVLGVDLREAHELASQSPHWAAERIAQAQLLDELYAAFDDKGN